MTLLVFFLYHKISISHVDVYAREAFDNLNRQLSATSASTANAISKAFETFKGELEIGHGEESEQESAGTQYHESLGEPPAKKRWNNNKKKIGKSPEFEALIDSEILNSLKQDLLKEETSPEVDSELASKINSMPKDGLSEEKLQEKVNKHQEWMLSTHLFQEIVVTWGTPTIEASCFSFIHPGNQIQKLLMRDTFSISWNDHFCFMLFPHLV